ncbi:MAG TPA: YoaK family protein [Bacillota bacterium]|nr:YoaK family protein [Bacillota bacterium]HPT86295.1 YoaK family protein [Bacillota bacterium]
MMPGIIRKLDSVKKNLGQIYLHSSIHDSVPFGVLLAIVGGFLDAYTFITRDGVFANAQTGNIVLLGVYAAQGDWGQALVHLPPLLAFVIGVFVTEVFKHLSGKFFILDWKQLALIFESIILFIIGFIPQTAPDIIVTVIISFVASIQVCSFSKLVDSPYSTTMSTGNLRSATQAAYQGIFQKDHLAAIRSIRYFTIIISFISGGFIGGLITFMFGIKSIFFTVFLLVFCVLLLNIERAKTTSEATVKNPINHQ